MNVKEEIREKYDKGALATKNQIKNLADLHKNISPVMRYYRMRKVQTFLALGNFKKGSKILDIGCNTGQYTTLLNDLGYKMFGIDLSKEAIELAKENNKQLNLNIEYFQADVENLNIFKENSFDGVVSFSTLRYVSNLKKALKEIYRVTKKGGKITLDFPNKHCPWFNILKKYYGLDRHINDHFFSTNELRNLFREVGLSEIKTRKILFTHYTFKPAFLNFYRMIDFLFEKTFFIKETAAIIVCKGIQL